MNQEHQVTEYRAGEIIERVSPLDALATMSDAEFRLRLDQLKAAQKRMETIQRELMTPDIDYGIIPGTGTKPTLLKAGAEKLAKFHRLVPTFGQQTILGDGVNVPHIRVLTVCSLHAETEDGPIVGQGLGAANSWEKKYRYRDAQRLCPMCGEPTIFKSKNDGGWFCWAKKGGCGVQFPAGDAKIEGQTQGQVKNPDPFDTENTLEKMSAKRAYVDATLRATATSGLFSQDLEDMADGDVKAPASPKAASPKPAGPARPPTQFEQPPKGGEAVGSYTEEDMRDLSHFLRWAYNATKLKQGDMLALLGVENALLILDKHETFRQAAAVLLTNVPPVAEAQTGAAGGTP